MKATIQTFVHNGCRITTNPHGAWKHECAKCGRDSHDKPRKVWEEGGMERTVHVVCKCGAKYQYCG
jgi:hypothetical protein